MVCGGFITSKPHGKIVKVIDAVKFVLKVVAVCIANVSYGVSLSNETNILFEIK